MTRGEALQMDTVSASTDELVTYFSEHELLSQDGSLLYRAAKPAASPSRVTLRLDPDRVRDRRLRGLLGNGVIANPSPEAVEIGCLRIVRYGRDMRVYCALGPHSERRLLFTLRNIRNRLCYMPAVAGDPIPHPEQMVVRSSTRS